MIHWDPSQKALDHRKAGHTLEGKHAELTCQQSHNARNIPESERPAIKARDLNRTFLGLSQDCVSCHGDRHRGQLGKNCLACHTLHDWKKTSGFNHSKTKFPLNGAHMRVACEKCHKPQDREEKTLKYIGLVFGNFSACHADPHRVAFKADCESCHTTTTWEQVAMPALTARFDHAKTKFPLTGRHSGLRCSTCHHGQAFSVPMAHEKCADCHTPDPHHGQFRARKDGGACEACHTVDGFKSARFGLVDHASTGFPLEGKHAAVPCAKCHRPAGPETLYTLKHDACTDCHADIHRGQFAGPPYGNRCGSCHAVKEFIPSTFSLTRHERTRFRLTGGHVAVACADCHQARKLPGTAHPVPYQFDDLTCTGCHDDPHHGQFTERMRFAGPDGRNMGCEACHTTKDRADTSRFDHASTAFPLIGTHRAAPCMSCHKPANLELTMKNVSFALAPRRCESCHDDIHAGQFSREGINPGCPECHNTYKWKPSLFDHETRTSFPLKGAPKDVRGVACHKTAHEVEDRTVLFYKLKPRDCAACHSATKPS